MNVTLIGQAVGPFAVTNIDDIVILALFFGQAVGRHGVGRVVLGQYLGFAAILTASILGALSARLLPGTVVPYLGLLPLILGVRSAVNAWRDHRSRTAHDIDDDAQHDHEPSHGVADQKTDRGPGALTVAAVTLANGGDDIGVYVPVFTASGTSGLSRCSWCSSRCGALPVTSSLGAPRCSRAIALGTHPVARRPHRHRIDHPHEGHAFGLRSPQMPTKRMVPLGQQTVRCSELHCLSTAVAVERACSDDGRDSYYHLDPRHCLDLLTATGPALHPALRLQPAAPSTQWDRSASVLFVCTANSARSAIAEALLRHHSGGQLRVNSAGTRPKPRMNPRARGVLCREYRVDITEW